MMVRRGAGFSVKASGENSGRREWKECSAIKNKGE